jgi:pimeloyl-ACP methyl ester carboxylesterase
VPEPPFEVATWVSAPDGTKLYCRSTSPDPSLDPPPASARAGARAVAPAAGANSTVSSSQLRAFFCDGIGCDGFVWKHIFADLQHVLPMTHWHYRGHGRSAPPVDPDAIGIGDHAEDLLSVRRAMGMPPSILFGHSMGVQVALEHYHRHPENVRALVLACGSYGKVTQTVRGVPIVEAILPSLLRFVDKYPEVVRAVWTRVPHEMALKVAMKMGDLDAEHARIEDVLPYLTHMVAVDIGMFLRMLKAAGEHSAENFLGDIKVPVLIVAAERDTFTPVWLSETLAREIPDADMLMVPAGSHAAPVERADLVVPRIRRFLSERVGLNGP